LGARRRIQGEPELTLHERFAIVHEVSLAPSRLACFARVLTSSWTPILYRELGEEFVAKEVTNSPRNFASTVL
jgi:hypothetical protein